MATINGTTNSDNLIGTTSNDSVNGLAGNDTITSSAGIDTLAGGTGDDTYVIDATGLDDVIVETAGEGTDTLQTSVSYTLGSANIENLILNMTGNSFLSLTGNSLNNRLTAIGSGYATLDGGAGNDTIYGGINADTLKGGADNDLLIDTNDSADVLDGGQGVDNMQGGRGDDIYFIDNTGDVVSENLNEGTDTVRSSVSYTLVANTENLTLTGADSINATGNELSNILVGNDGANLISGGAGADDLLGGAGNDTLTGGDGADVLRTSSGSDQLIGGLGDDIYIVDANGSDDTIIENANEGYDTIQTTKSFTVAEANIEKVVLSMSGFQTLTATGNNLNNVMTAVGFGYANIDGGAGEDTITGAQNNDTLKGGADNDLLIDTGETADVLDGGLGLDVMKGGRGNDTYYVDNTGDVVTENINEGADLVNSGVSYTLSANLEDLTLTGSDAINATGNELSNILVGNGGANTLSGGSGSDDLFGGSGNDTLLGGDGADTLRTSAGADQLIGGLGDDLYIVDSNGGDDAIIENAGEGVDTIQTNSNYTLQGVPDIENILVAMSGNQTFNVTGNAANNSLTAIGFGFVKLEGGSGSDTLTGSQNSDTLMGGADNDLLVDSTGSSADTLDGGEGADTMRGGLGDDSYFVDNTQDVIVEYGNAGFDIVNSSVSYMLGGNLERLVLTGTASINGTGNYLNNTIIGNSGDNILNGGTGADQLTGGLGNDTYIVDASDTVTENFGQGIDTVLANFTYTLGSDIENLTLTGLEAINGTGNGLNNILTGNTAVNVLSGGLGDDTYIIDSSDVITENAGEGTDTVQAGFTTTLGNNLENLTLTGTSAINGTGNTANNVLTGNSNNNTLDGGAGADTLIGGSGNDTYIIDSLDTVTEAAGGGTDLVQAGFSYTLGANLENLTLTGNTAINATGNSLNNILTGNSAANVLTGGLGNDTYVIDATDSIVENANEGTDTVMASFSATLGLNLENLTLTGSAAINGTGNAVDNALIGNTAANTLSGGAGNDTLNGNAGADTLIGGIGNDTYVIDSSDVITENAGEGTDTVQAGFTTTLGNNLENLTLTGTSAINGTGNTANNVLTGNSNNNTLDGGAGADTLVGGSGNDTYLIDSLDTVTEATGGGTDLVQAGFSYTLGANLENLTLTGNTAINATGNSLNNVLTGNSAANVLTGGLGNDTYVIDATDSIVENANEGTDTVMASFSATLGLNLENLTLTGSAAINGTGNAVDNIMTGNIGANTLSGGAGNDVYIIDGTDTVLEYAGEGIDLVQADFSYTLGANIENLTLTGTTAINGTGNSLNNVLIGNLGANQLSGGAGNDTYVIDSSDTVTENAAEGTDLIQAGFSYTLGANLENLTLTGTSAINGTGNGLDNVLTGNGNANVLDGNSGSDTLIGGAGNDTYILNRGYGVDWANDTDVTVGNTDTVAFGSDIASDQIWFRHSGNDLEVSIIGTTDKLTVQNWYLGNQNQIELFKAGNGKTLTNLQVENLVAAMATFSVPPAGQTTLSQSYQDALSGIIAANWQ